MPSPIPLGGSSMFKLIVATLAALFAFLHVFGEPDRRVEVARAASDPEVAGLSLASFVGIEPPPAQSEPKEPSISDAEAIRLALAASARARAEQDTAPLRGAVTAAIESKEDATDPADVESKAFWYVTGSQVNLRQGPGTGNAVIGRVTLGTEAEVLADRNGWYQIRTADGSATGWIYGKFLDQRDPG